MKTTIILMMMSLCPLLSGCGSLNRPYPDKTLHALHVGEPPAPAATSAGASATPASKMVLRVDRVILAEPFDATTFIYQVGDSTYKSDYYNGFVAPPSRLLTGEISGYLAGSSLFATVFSGDSMADYQLSLETNVTCLCGDYRDAAKPTAVLAVRFFLIDQAQGRFVVLFDKTYSQQIPIEGKGPDGLVKGWESGWASVLSQLASDLRGTSLVMSGK